MLKEGSNWVDPDNYGYNHGYMDYGNGPLDIEEEIMSNPKLMEEKATKQTDILNRFDKSRMGWDKDVLIDKYHTKGVNRACTWSTVEKFRYLEELYKVNPRLFPNLSKDQFESMKKEFYDNQPIILTLPFVKGGMKK